METRCRSLVRLGNRDRKLKKKHETFSNFFEILFIHFGFVSDPYGQFENLFEFSYHVTKWKVFKISKPKKFGADQSYENFLIHFFRQLGLYVDTCASGIFRLFRFISWFCDINLLQIGQ